MTADRRDWVDVVCDQCDWGVRVAPEHAETARENHKHNPPWIKSGSVNLPEKSQEEKTWKLDMDKGYSVIDHRTHNVLAEDLSPQNAVKMLEELDDPYVRVHPQGSVSPSKLTREDLEAGPGVVMEYNSGVRRTPKAGKINWSLVLDGPLLGRLARHLTKGEETHGKRNWMKANSEEDLERFRESAVRHFMQWWNGETDEDHFAATVFNMNGAELCKERLREERLPDPDETGYA